MRWKCIVSIQQLINQLTNHIIITFPAIKRIHNN